VFTPTALLGIFHLHCLFLRCSSVLCRKKGQNACIQRRYCCAKFLALLQPVHTFYIVQMCTDILEFRVRGLVCNNVPGTYSRCSGGITPFPHSLTFTDIHNDIHWEQNDIHWHSQIYIKEIPIYPLYKFVNVSECRFVLSECRCECQWMSVNVATWDRCKEQADCTLNSWSNRYWFMPVSVAQSVTILARPFIWAVYLS